MWIVALCAAGTGVAVLASAASKPLPGKHPTAQQRSLAAQPRGPVGDPARSASAAGPSLGAGKLDPLARPRAAFPAPGMQRNLLAALGSLVTPSTRSASDRTWLLQRKPVLRKVARTMPDLVLDPSGIRLNGAKDSQLLTLAPGALQRFERRIDVLHMMGLRHNDIRPENIVIDRYGELQLVDWQQVAPGGSAETDRSGLDAVRSFLRRRLGV